MTDYKIVFRCMHCGKTIETPLMNNKNIQSEYISLCCLNCMRLGTYRTIEGIKKCVFNTVNPFMLSTYLSSSIGSCSPIIDLIRKEMERQNDEIAKKVMYEKLYNPYDHQVDCNRYHGITQAVNARNFGKTNLLQQINNYGGIMTDSIMKKFATGGLVPTHKNKKEGDFFQLLKDYVPLSLDHKSFQENVDRLRKSLKAASKAEDYSFGVTCEESVDLHKIAEDLDNDNYCFHVITDNTTTPKVNAILIHRSIIRKALILKMERPVGINFENFKTFGAFYISGHGHEVVKKIDVPKKLDYTDYKRVMAWVSSVKKAKYSDHVNTRINGKPITVKVTNCSRVD